MTLLSQTAATCCQKESDGDSTQMLIVTLDVLASMLPDQPFLHAQILQVGRNTLSNCCASSHFAHHTLQLQMHRSCHLVISKSNVPVVPDCHRGALSLFSYQFFEASLADDLQ